VVWGQKERGSGGKQIDVYPQKDRLPQWKGRAKFLAKEEAGSTTIIEPVI